MTDGHKLEPTILREYDVRGIVGETLNPEDVYAVARAFGTTIVRGGGTSVSIGYDGRLSSPELEKAAIDGLGACGLKVYRVGLGPTPMLYLATFLLETDGGLMITGSHNPPTHNGIKMMLGGKSFFGQDIQKLGQIAEAGDYEAGGGQIIDRPMLDDYINRVAKDFRQGRDLKVAWDAGNGSAGAAMVGVTAKLPGTHFLLNEEIDGTFPNHHPDPTVEKNLEQLKEVVAREGCDFGVGFDGDGDRIGVIDSQGRVIWGDQLMTIWGKEILEQTPGATIIADVKASQVLFDEIARMGGNPVMYKTGHSLIKSKMAEMDSPFAGEMSGHIFFADRYYGFDDALYAAVRLMSIAANSDITLDQMRDNLPHTFSTPEIRFDCPDIRKFEVAKEVEARLASATGVSVSTVDGVRVQNDDGWWLLRASNTQAVLVARCEASSPEGLERLKSALSEQLQASDITPPDFTQ
ncbi:MAG: phosphomannomutase/phosphoglucomutase [Alphaproteobacteria bacterium]|nr:phosphomannomutase/phosphoglucomutase [Alphaproteobacteria bacterium]